MSSKKASKGTVEEGVRILKVASCPTLSGQSTLLYHVGCKNDSHVLFRIYGNSGGGFYSAEWVSGASIQQAMATGDRVSAISLHPVLTGRSANTAGFLMAVLKEEGLIVRSGTNPRQYVKTDPAKFVEEVTALIAAAVNLDPNQKPGKKTSAGKSANTSAKRKAPAKT